MRGNSSTNFWAIPQAFRIGSVAAVVNGASKQPTMRLISVAAGKMV